MTQINLFHGSMNLLTEEGYKSFADLSFFQSIRIINPLGKLQQCTIKHYGKFNVIELGIMWKIKNIICTKNTKIKLLKDLVCTAEHSFCKIFKSYNYNFGYEVLSINRLYDVECFGIIGNHYDLVVEDIIITGETND